jgi:uncharacterized protein (DUF1778 family)
MTAQRKPGLAADARITVRLTAGERRQLDKLAKAHGRTPSEYMRAKALGLPTQLKLPKVKK